MHSVSVHTSQTEILSSLFLRHGKSGHAFTLWREPGSTEKHFLVCTSGVQALNDLFIEDSKPGFAFAPFDNKKKKLFLSADIVHSFSAANPLENKFSEKELHELTTEFQKEIKKDFVHFPSVIP